MTGFFNRISPFLLLSALTLGGCVAYSAPDIQLRQSSRWIEVQTLSGDVVIGRSPIQPAQVGDRISNIGEHLSTGSNSNATLIFDQSIGVLRVRNNSTVEIAELEIDSTGAHITRLAVPQGTVNLQIRRFTNPNSSLQIETPSGIAGVRGTDFAVAINPANLMTVATTTGSVSTSAQGQTVIVNGGFYSLVPPNQAPTPAQPLGQPNLRVGIRRLELIQLSDGRPGVRISGVVHPINGITINGQPLATDLDGFFEPDVIALDNNHLSVTVLSPVWGDRTYGVTLTPERWQLDNPNDNREFILPARGTIIRGD